MKWAGAKYGFVIPRSGLQIAGGAETLVRNLAQKIVERDLKNGILNSVDIITTCAKDNRTWENFFSQGETIEQGVRVLRFEVSPRNLDVWVPLQIRLSEGMRLTPDEELLWMEHSVNSHGLYEYLDQYGQNYNALFFAPYLFGTTFWGSQIHPNKSFLIPCLHDESYAYTQCIQSMFRSVRGSLFNALPEKWLATDLYGEARGYEVGMGFDFDEYKVRSLNIKSPYILYVGRKETGKNLHLLVDYFVSQKNSGALPSTLYLVIAGGGDFSDLNRPKAKERSDITDLTNVSEDEKKALIQNAICLVQPSVNESFSIVLMESWLEKTPVVVHSRCPVTKYHVEESSGGLYFGSEQEFSAVVNYFIDNPNIKKEFGINGLKYVHEIYSWSKVLERFDNAVERLSL